MAATSPRHKFFVVFLIMIFIIARYILALLLLSIIYFESKNEFSEKLWGCKEGAVHGVRHRGGSGWCT